MTWPLTCYTYRDSVWHGMEGDLAISVLEVTMFLFDTLSAETYRSWFLAVETANLVK